MIRSAIFALALLPVLAMAQDVPPCPDINSMQQAGGCSTVCRHSSGAMMTMPIKCSVVTGAMTLRQSDLPPLPTCSIRVTAEQMLAQCQRGMTVDQCLQYLASDAR